MTTSPRSIGRWALGICALASALLPMSSASALSYPPGPSEDTVVAGSFFTVTVACEVGEIVLFVFEGVTIEAECTPAPAQLSAQGTTESVITQVSSQALTNPGIASARFRAPSTSGVYVLTIVAGGVTYTLEIVVQGKPRGGGSGSGSGSGSGFVGRSGNSPFPTTGASGLPLSLSIGASALLTGGSLYAVARRRHRMRLAG